MTPVIFERDDEEIHRLVDTHPMIEADSMATRELSAQTGTAVEIAKQIELLKSAWVERVMLQ